MPCSGGGFFYEACRDFEKIKLIVKILIQFNRMRELLLHSYKLLWKKSAWKAMFMLV